MKFRKLYAVDIDKKGILRKDVCFGSPSYAFSFVCGRNSNGLIEWKNSEEKTLKELNDESKDTAKKTKGEKKAKTPEADVDDEQIEIE